MILSCKNIKKNYGINTILDDISFQINGGERIALVGRNGAGKSTLFKIIAGELAPDEGSCTTPRNTSMGYLSQHLDLNEKNTLWEEIMEIFVPLIAMEKQLRQLEQDISSAGKNEEDEKMHILMEEYGHLQEDFEKQNGYGYPSQIRGILKGLGFEEQDYDKQIVQFSGGQKTRIALGKLLLQEPDILLLDEPTNFLDLETVEWLEGFLSSYASTLFIISHDRYFLDALVTQVFEIENHKLYTYNGNYSQYVKEKGKTLEVLSHQYEQQQKEIKRQEEIIQRFRSFNREKSIKKAESRQKMLDKMERIDSPVTQLPTLHLTLEPQVKSGRDVLKVEGLSKSFGELKLFSDLNFQIFIGDHIGIIGPNGVGKSTLFKIILGELTGDEGEVILGSHVYPAYYDQLQTSLDENNTIIEEVWQVKPTALQTEIRNVLGAFLFSGDDVFKSISTLSGGEKSRVALAKLMLSQANLLLMDEPTNHIDIATKEVLEDALMQYKGTLLVISHDRYFLNKVTNKIFEMKEEKIQEYLGNYQYYLEKKKQQQLLQEAQEIQPIINKTQLKQERKKERANQKLLKEQRQKISGLEKEIESLEGQIEDFESLMCQPNFYEDGDNALTVTKEYEDAKLRLKEYIANWEEDMIILEEMQEG
ncbi:ABC-F family ATP-binding cassette domain-containing protein [Irregularibacter muris]|uniref:ABC-F family ATP-binding cassette domain-containing protein n=1 Tax=Irregularibacter muris TaxID=1796619 RepID=A0AAE3HG95_9FIRM|nr:ABC-F family ATP-binding cassette domain-containing protein [Irregularibacter muris]MCR1898884.1 ABC-F family ATP-binding cassette domain-containing protein [Irregularibacter muris]